MTLISKCLDKTSCHYTMGLGESINEISGFWMPHYHEQLKHHRVVEPARHLGARSRMQGCSWASLQGPRFTYHSETQFIHPVLSFCPLMGWYLYLRLPALSPNIWRNLHPYYSDCSYEEIEALRLTCPKIQWMSGRSCLWKPASLLLPNLSGPLSW